jgi:hypothetical protein
MPKGWHQSPTQWQLKYQHPALKNVFTLEVYRNGSLALVRLVEDASSASEQLMNVHVRHPFTSSNQCGIGHPY